MAGDGSYIVDTLLNTDGIDKGLKSTEKSFTSLADHAKKIGLIIGSALAVDGLVDFGKKALSVASDLQEVQNVVDVTFTTMSDSVNQFSKDAATSAGLSETMAKEYTGTFGTMAKAMGYTETEAYDLATALTQFTGDLASFRNLSQDEAFTKLQAIFTGETESLKALGVVMTQTNLDAYAMAKGFGKTTEEMTEQEKVALRAQYVLEQLSAAQGDYVRTSDSWANQTKNFQLQTENLMTTIGTGLITLLTPALQTLNDSVLPALMIAAENVAVGLSKISTWISQNQSLIIGMTTTVAAFGAAWLAIDLAKWVVEAGGVISVLKKMVVAFNSATIAKVADKAVDLQLIALYTVDYVKAFAKVIANLASAAAAWAAKTAATVASTAAEWAQIAATTAWNAICTVATTVTTAFGAAVAFLTSPIGLVVVAITALIGIIALLIANWDTVKEVAARVWSAIQDVWSDVSAWFSAHVLEPISEVFANIFEAAETAFNGIKAAVGGVWDSIVESTLSVWNSIVDAIAGAIAKIQGWINSLTGKTVSANVKVSSNTGVSGGGGGGSSSGGNSGTPFALARITPQVPYLATGAVIPPNAPFMAVLGDQRHGTNVEAPLATIQEAVRAEVGGMMGGFEALAERMDRLIYTVENIEVGDTVIGEAASRYTSRQKMIHGGGVV